MTKVSGAGTSEDDEEAGHGIEVRLKAIQKTWKKGEVPSFAASVRNATNNDYNIYRTQMMWVVELDGIRYTWSRGVEAKSCPLPSGQECSGIPITLVDSWQRAEDGTSLDLREGKHTLRAVCPLFPSNGQNASTSPVEVVSNPVEFEVIPAR